MVKIVAPEAPGGPVPPSMNYRGDLESDRHSPVHAFAPTINKIYYEVGVDGIVFISSKRGNQLYRYYSAGADVAVGLLYLRGSARPIWKGKRSVRSNMSVMVVAVDVVGENAAKHVSGMVGALGFRVEAVVTSGEQAVDARIRYGRRTLHYVGVPAPSNQSRLLRDSHEQQNSSAPRAKSRKGTDVRDAEPNAGALGASFTRENPPALTKGAMLILEEVYSMCASRNQEATNISLVDGGHGSVVRDDLERKLIAHDKAAAPIVERRKDELRSD